MFNAPLFQSVRHTVVRLATEQDVIFARGSTPHTTAKVLDNLNSAKPRLAKTLDCLFYKRKANRLVMIAC